MDIPDDPLRATTGDAQAPAAANHPGGRIEGWRDFGDRFRAALAMGTTEAADWRLCDPDFTQWPLGERAVVEALQEGMLVHPRTRLTLLAARFEAFPRLHPRWLRWRQPWSHRVHCLQACEDEAPQLRPMLLWPGRVGLRLLDGLSGRGVWSTDPATLLMWQADFDVISQRSTEAMPSTTLGL